MERFTQPDFDPCANCGERGHCEHITNPDFTILCGQAEMYKRLSDYEDMGLEPHDILNATDMAKIACALHELNKYKELGDLDRLRDLAEADRDGRCVVLPCKVGSKVYVTGRKKIVEAEVQEIYLDDREGMEMLVHFKCDTSCAGCPFNSLKQDWDGEWSCDGEYGDGCVFQREFGKTVFLTREAAEAALKGEQNGKDDHH